MKKLIKKTKAKKVVEKKSITNKTDLEKNVAEKNEAENLKKQKIFAQYFEIMEDTYNRLVSLGYYNPIKKKNFGKKGTK